MAGHCPLPILTSLRVILTQPHEHIAVLCDYCGVQYFVEAQMIRRTGTTRETILEWGSRLDILVPAIANFCSAPTDP